MQPDPPLEAAKALGAEMYINLEEKCKDALRRFLESEPEDESDVPSGDEIERYVVRHMAEELNHTAAVLPDLFSDFLHLLEIVMLHRRAGAAFGPLSEDIRGQCVDMAREWFNIIMERRGLVKETRPGVASVIPDDKALQVLLNIGQMSPSRHRLAKELDTTPATVRAWLRRKGVDSPADIMSSLMGGIRAVGDEELCQNCGHSAAQHGIAEQERGSN